MVRARIFVHDLCGHPFQLQLSKELARRGHIVRHVYSAEFETGKGDVTVPPSLARNLEIVAADTGRDFVKYSIPGRIRSEIRYGKRVAELAEGFEPDVALTANDPLIAKLIMSRRFTCPWVVWEQDLIFKMVQRLDLPVALRGLAVRLVERLEKRSLDKADRVVCISDDFVEELSAIGVDPAKATVIENWAPLDEIQPWSRPTAWAIEQGLGDRPFLLYSGTLGLKHDPELLASLAERLRADGVEADVVVVSEGTGADYLAEQKSVRGLDNLHLFGFQPYDRLGEVLSSATGLIVLLEPEAGAMSVPSKVLSYLCAGRPILGSIPPANAASRQLLASGAAFLAQPGDADGFMDAALDLLGASDLERRAAGARRYAEQRFGIEAIGDPRDWGLHAEADIPRQEKKAPKWNAKRKGWDKGLL